MDLMAGENRQEEHLKRNPSGQSPTLELDDGSFSVRDHSHMRILG